MGPQFLIPVAVLFLLTYMYDILYDKRHMASLATSDRWGMKNPAEPSRAEPELPSQEFHLRCFSIISGYIEQNIFP